MATGQRGGWAIAIKGRRDAAAILMIVSDRAEAEAIAEEMTTRGQQVEVQRVGMRSGSDGGGATAPTEPKAEGPAPG
jgi:hypothetical protein